MEWIKIDPNNSIPLGEVIAGFFNIDSGNFGFKVIGMLRREYSGQIVCDDDNDGTWYGVTHYIELNIPDPKN